MKSLPLAATLLCLGAATSFGLAQVRLYTLDTRGGIHQFNTDGTRFHAGNVSANAGIPGGLAYDCQIPAVYMSSVSNSALYRLNLDTGQATLIGPFAVPQVQIDSLLWNPTNAVLYGASSLNGNLYIINTQTGAASLMGDTGLASISALGFQDFTQIIYATDGAGGLFTIDPTTAHATLVPGARAPLHTTGMAFDPLWVKFYNSSSDDQLFTLPSTMNATPVGLPAVPSAVYHPERLRAFWDAMSSRRVDFAVCGDSNQYQSVIPYRGHGIALMQVLRDHYGLYADRLMAAFAFGSQAADCYGTGSSMNQQNWLESAGGPQALSSRMFSIQTLEGLDYAGWLGGYSFLPAGATSPTTDFVDGGGPITGVPNDPYSSLPGILPDITQYGYRHHFTLMFPQGSHGVVHPSVRLLLTWQDITAGGDADWSLNGTPQGQPTPDVPFDAFLDVPPDPDQRPRQLQMQAVNVNAAEGEVALLYHRAESVQVRTGAAVTIPHAAGGKGMRYFAEAIMSKNASSPLALRELLRQLCRLQDGPPMLCWMFMHKGNDSGDIASSYVWNNGVPMPIGPAGNTPEGYRNNLEVCIRLLDAAWAQLGYDPANLIFIDSAYHPQLAMPHVETLPAFEAAGRSLSDSNAHPAYQRLACVAGTQLTTPQQMAAEGWYRAGGFDTAHLTSPAYLAIQTAQVKSIEAALGIQPKLTGLICISPAQCPGETQCSTADFDGDGDFGTDFDIEAFFSCLAGHCCDTCWPAGADFNGDGDFGTDGDIESFFRVLAGNPC